MTSLSAEEMALLCLYDTSNRLKLLNDLKIVRPYIDNPEMIALFKNASNKLLNMSDEEFDRIEFISSFPLL